MASVISKLIEKGISNAPKWIADNIMFEAKSGSYAYGVNTSSSDDDYVGYCIAPKALTFYDGEIPGFGKQKNRFESYQEHHLKHGNEEYDVTCYNITIYFNLCAQGNPNLFETLYYPIDCITFNSQVSQLVRDHRHLFVSKAIYHKMKGYAFSQISDALKVAKDENVINIRRFEEENHIPHATTYEFLMNEIKYRQSHGCFDFQSLDNNKLNVYKNLYEAGLNKSKRFEKNKTFNFDPKSLYHVARLTNFARQILETGDLDTRMDREYWKAIRRGEVSVKEVQLRFNEEERQLQKLYETSSVQHNPDWEKIKILLLNVLESHYGKLSGFEKESKYLAAINDISEILRKYKV